MQEDNRRLSSTMIKIVQCKKCHKKYYEDYPYGQCECGSYEAEEIDYLLSDLIEKAEKWDALVESRTP